MATFYEEMQAVATELLDEFKQGVMTVTHVQPGVSDPETPWIPGLPAKQTYRVSATLRTVQKKYIDGTTIIGNEEQATIAVDAILIAEDGTPVTEAAAKIKPTMTDEITVDGLRRVVKAVKAIPPAGIPVAFVVIMEG